MNEALNHVEVRKPKETDALRDPVDCLFLGGHVWSTDKSYCVACGKRRDSEETKEAGASA